MAVDKSIYDDTFRFFQGATSPTLRPRPTVLSSGEALDADWNCYIAANNMDGTSAITKREVTAKTSDGLRWIAALHPDETDTLAVTVGKATEYVMVIQVENTTTTPPFNDEKHYLIQIDAQGIT